SGIIRVGIARARRVLVRKVHRLISSLPVTLNEGCAATHEFLHAWVNLLLRGIVLRKFLLELLAVHIAKLGSLHIVIRNRLVTLSYDLRVLLPNLVHPVGDLLLRSLLSPLGYLFCIGCHVPPQSLIKLCSASRAASAASPTAW